MKCYYIEYEMLLYRVWNTTTVYEMLLYIYRERVWKTTEQVSIRFYFIILHCAVKMTCVRVSTNIYEMLWNFYEIPTIWTLMHGLRLSTVPGPIFVGLSLKVFYNWWNMSQRVRRKTEIKCQHWGGRVADWKA